MKRRTLFAGALGLLLLAGYAFWIDRTSVSGKMETALGLSFLVPEGRTLEVGERGIMMSNPKTYRSSDYIALHPNGLPDLADYASGELVSRGDKPAAFEVWARGGGSGGEEYALTTTKVVDGKTVDVVGVFQTEWGTPNFAETWAVWESLELAE